MFGEPDTLNTDAKHHYPKLILFAVLGTNKNIVTLPVVCEPTVSWLNALYKVKSKEGTHNQKILLDSNHL